MLGINSPRELVKASFAKEVRESLRRSMTGNLTASEKKVRQSLKTASTEWKIVWKSNQSEAEKCGQQTF